MDGWVEREIEGCAFPDQRLKTRFGKLLGQLSEKIGAALPTACQDWAATKAAYRFFDNARVDESILLAGHFAATKPRMAAAKGPILMLHDTTEFSFQREKPEAIGKTRKLPSARIGSKPITKCGLLMHSSLAVTTAGKPLGLTAVKFWTRKKFKGTNALKGANAGTKHTVNHTRIPIEEKESIRWLENLEQSTQLVNPDRCVHIGDRESDIYELFCLAEEKSTHFLVRTCVDRVAGTGSTTIARKMKREPIQGTHQIEVQDTKRRPIKVTLQLRYSQMTVHPPIGKHKKYPSLSLTVIHAWERGKPKGRKSICWKLLTDLPVDDLESAIEKVEWYSQRWKIETFYKILKSGCRVEEAKLRTAERLTNLIALFCIIAWRVFWLTMVRRTNPNTSADAVFTETEIAILNHVAGKSDDPAPKNISHYLIVVAKLGGYLNRKNDGPPGNTVIWRGLSRLTDIHFGVEISEELVGN
ncbi:MAG: IS4 family transposase [Planctomycetota bacterium]|nr:MAG: IS4 family transposase [Planctomycetota bacterium]REJ92837.1 MAG: IS4 family transposase [Planctomycetota bacterium]REK24618.1 MAG: IS4 family transposase [Planctomycetota bacterium]REK38344.1 MAG: IS4 family transposase [Planctomycetota bacterium]